MSIEGAKCYITKLMNLIFFPLSYSCASPGYRVANADCEEPKKGNMEMNMDSCKFLTLNGDLVNSHYGNLVIALQHPLVVPMHPTPLLCLNYPMVKKRDY